MSQSRYEEVSEYIPLNLMTREDSHCLTRHSSSLRLRHSAWSCHCSCWMGNACESVMKAAWSLSFRVPYPTKKWLQPSRAWQGSLKRAWHELPTTKGSLFGFGGSCFLPTAPVAQLVQKLAQCPSPSCAHGHGTVIFLKGKSKHCAKTLSENKTTCVTVWSCLVLQQVLATRGWTLD